MLLAYEGFNRDQHLVTRETLLGAIVAQRRLGLHLGQYHTGWVSSVAWSPDGTRLATASADATILWDVASGKRLASLTGASSVAWSPDGTRLAIASLDDAILVLCPGNGDVLKQLAACRIWRNFTVN